MKKMQSTNELREKLDGLIMQVRQLTPCKEESKNKDEEIAALRTKIARLQVKLHCISKTKNITWFFKNAEKAKWRMLLKKKSATISIDGKINELQIMDR